MTPGETGLQVLASPGVRVLHDRVARAGQPILEGRADLVIPSAFAADGRTLQARPWSPLHARYGHPYPPIVLASEGWAAADASPRDVLHGSPGDARVAVVDLPVGVEPRPGPATTVVPPRPARVPIHPPLASVVIPTRDRSDLLHMVHRTLCASGWPRVEVIFVDNGSTDPLARAWLDSTPHRVIEAPMPFNFARLANRGAAAARGEFIVLLNNDIQALAEGWLRDLLDPFAVPDVGVVGSTLLYPSGAVQHCGITVADGVPVHAFAGVPEADLPDYLRLLPGERTAVTGACMAVRASLWRFLGGMASPLATNYNDVDLCLRARRAGARVACTPMPRLVHHESESRGGRATPEVAADWLLFRSRWSGVLSRPDSWMAAG